MPDDTKQLPQGKTQVWVEGVEPDPTPAPKVNNRKYTTPAYTQGQKELKRLQKT